MKKSNYYHLPPLILKIYPYVSAYFRVKGKRKIVLKNNDIYIQL